MHLEQSHWIDRRTKSLSVEFVVFNANVNLFCVVTLILESNNVGTKTSSLLPLTWVSQKSQFLTPLQDIILIKVIAHNTTLKVNYFKAKTGSPHFPPHSYVPEAAILESFSNWFFWNLKSTCLLAISRIFHFR